LIAPWRRPVHILPNPDAPADTPAPSLPLYLIPAPLDGPAAQLRGTVLYLDPSASRDDLLHPISEAAVFLATGDPGSARVPARPRHLHAVEVSA
jgi:hypothetical protein